MQPQVHLVDETWIDAAPETVSAVVSDPASWRRWWPYLQLTVTRDRGVKGMQFAAGPAAVRPGPRPARASLIRRRRPALTGTVEIWLEPFKSGVILHHFLRLEPAAGERLSARGARRLARELSWHAKRVFWQLKDDLELPV